MADTTDNLRAVDLPRPCSAGSFPARQDALDWQVFAAAFQKRNGFVPHTMDTGHKEYFHWFTVGAHEEFMGRLTVKPNASDQIREE